MTRITKTVAAGSVGFLAGLLLEQGLESLVGLDFVDGVLAVGGAGLGAFGVNRDLLRAAQRNIKRMFGKDPLEISEGEWNQFKSAYPKMAERLEKALSI